ncbi:MAG: radical SAM family heme chaperone HemW [Actinomycetota bacterium]
MSAFGVYLHIPFCAARCDYCAFATWTDRDHLIDRYLEAMRADIARAVGDGMPAATSVFVGGGTPSLVPADALAEVIASVPTTADAEVTVECNPDDVDAASVATLVDGGVDRLSVGVQSTSAHVLAALGRGHDRTHVDHAVEVIRASGIRSFNLDLIYGAAGESVEDWRSTVEHVLHLEPPHVSAYGLMVEPGTPLAADERRHPDDDDQADKYHLVDELLSTDGLENYEVSNWARPGHESVHNRLYWAQGDYLGVGCAAHSHVDGRRWWNVRTPERYIDLVERGAPTEAAHEVLDDATRRTERLQLSLRTRDGVERAAFDPDTLTLLDGLVTEHPEDEARVVLTRGGRLLANDISTRFADADR